MSDRRLPLGRGGKGGGQVPDRRLAERFQPGTEGGAGLVVAATLVYGAVATNGAGVFLVSTAIYLAVAAWIWSASAGRSRLLGKAVLGTALDLHRHGCHARCAGSEAPSSSVRRTESNMVDEALGSLLTLMQLEPAWR